jgi:hypothetical protein
MDTKPLSTRNPRGFLALEPDGFDQPGDPILDPKTASVDLHLKISAAVAGVGDLVVSNPLVFFWVDLKKAFGAMGTQAILRTCSRSPSAAPPRSGTTSSARA